MYFTLSQTQYLALAVFGGLLLVLMLVIGYWSFRLNLARRERHESEWEKEEYPDGLAVSNRPIPLFIILLIGAFLVWGIGYVVAIALGGLFVQ